jgi:2-polyprenyl-3-methyl-5-hydroxy-6-metoxy-1,4-benzoquinol methylase
MFAALCQLQVESCSDWFVLPQLVGRLQEGSQIWQYSSVEILDGLATVQLLVMVILMISKADWKYWDRVSKVDDPHIAPQGETIRRWIEKFCPSTPSGTCLEIGCYPGRFLAVLGEMGYELYGVDFAERVESLSVWMKSRNYRVGGFWHEDFFEFRPDKKFDVVLSLGFIEHYVNWQAVLDRHMDLVAAQCLLVLSAPNFLGRLQNWFHRTLDAESYDRHHVPAMNVEEWARRVEKNGFKVIYKGYFGPCDFWVEEQQRSFAQKVCLELLTMARPLFRRLLPEDNKLYSPYGGLVAQRGPSSTQSRHL